MLHFTIKFDNMMYINTGVFILIVRTGFIQESFIGPLCISSEIQRNFKACQPMIRIYKKGVDVLWDMEGQQLKIGLVKRNALQISTMA